LVVASSIAPPTGLFRFLAGPGFRHIVSTVYFSTRNHSMSFTPSAHARDSADPESASKMNADEIAHGREELAQRIGRLLARHWLRQRQSLRQDGPAEIEVASKNE
jgi:hypothetical protein